MKSIKPGRGPSMMGGVMSVAVAIFGIIWTGLAASMGAGPFALFGIVFIAIAVFNAVYNFKNATGENRYSIYDITDHGEEPDPLNQRFGTDSHTENETRGQRNGKEYRFCPYCGTELKPDFVYCNSCGKKLP
ncbi:MAG: zinc ribbon domain-containing protein [Ruminococcaceae bacterium]|nr:zinc ribbon domain-containing protein [Oscillospiraceae bacterium]